ncbi:hypothetical protein AC249_AIPGENE9639 [Exaiptasia diaphana]|nr:hypothetical protein AC249_AIPGENE9639 [Exaiptasia diaphana]
MALHYTQWIVLSFVLAFCLVQSTHSVVPREKVAQDSAQNPWGPCGRHACGKRNHEPNSEKESAENVFKKGATVVGTTDKKVSRLNVISLKHRCGRFGLCRKRNFLPALPKGKKMLDDQLHPDEQHPKTADQSKHEIAEPKSRCLPFGCKKSFDQTVMRNQQKKPFSDGMKDMQCGTIFGCYVKKNASPVQGKHIRQEMKAENRKSLNNDLLIHRRFFRKSQGEN